MSVVKRLYCDRDRMPMASPNFFHRTDGPFFCPLDESKLLIQCDLRVFYWLSRPIFSCHRTPSFVFFSAQTFVFSSTSQRFPFNRLGDKNFFWDEVLVLLVELTDECQKVSFPLSARCKKETTRRLFRSINFPWRIKNTWTHIQPLSTL